MSRDDQLRDPPEDAAHHVPEGGGAGARVAESLGTVPDELLVVEVAEPALQPEYQHGDGRGERQRQVERDRLHAQFAGERGGDEAHQAGHRLNERRQVLDHHRRRVLAPLIGDVDVEVERLEEDVGEGDDDADAPQVGDDGRLLTQDVHLRLDVAQRDLQLPAADADVLVDEVLPPEHRHEQQADGERPPVDVDAHRRPRDVAEEDVLREAGGGGGRRGGGGGVSALVVAALALGHTRAALVEAARDLHADVGRLELAEQQDDDARRLNDEGGEVADVPDDALHLVVLGGSLQLLLPSLRVVYCGTERGHWQGGRWEVEDDALHSYWLLISIFIRNRTPHNIYANKKWPTFIFLSGTIESSKV